MNREQNPEATIMNNDQYSHGILRKYFGWICHISVEPTMWFYMMAYMLTSVVEEAFFVHKACRVNHGFSEEICQNITTNKTINHVVQITVSNFHQWNGIASHVVPIILALFIGNWSDRYGRKLPLIIGLLGKVIYSGMIVVNSLMPTWDVFMIIYTASIPMGLLCGDVAIFASCFAYISDVSSIKHRTLRVTILDIAYLSTMPTGVAFGSYLFTKVFNHSYTIMFIINTMMLILSVVYSMIVLKWQTTPQQQPLRLANFFQDFFDKNHVIQTMKTLTKPRKMFARLHLWLLFGAMALYTFQRDEKSMSYLYTQSVFKWDLPTFSKFRTFQSSLFVITMLFGVPLLTKVFGIRDTFVVCIGAISHAAGRVFFASATTPIIFYTGAAVAALGPIVAPVLRSMTSKVVPSTERGKVFTVLSICDMSVPLFSSILYTQLYNYTSLTVPSAIFWLTFATQIAVLFFILVIQFTSRSNQRKLQDDGTDENSADEGNPVLTENISTNGQSNISN